METRRCAYCANEMDTLYRQGCSDLCIERLRAWDGWIKRTQSPDHPMFHGDVNKPYKATAGLRLPPLSKAHAAQTVAFAHKQSELDLSYA